MCSWLKFTSRVWLWFYWYMICCRDSNRLTGFLSKSIQDPCTRALSRKLAWKEKVCKVLDSHYFWKTTFLPFWDTMTLQHATWTSNTWATLQDLVDNLSPNYQGSIPTPQQPHNLNSSNLEHLVQFMNSLPTTNHLVVWCALELDLIEFFNAWLQRKGNIFYFLFTFILFFVLFYFFFF